MLSKNIPPKQTTCKCCKKTAHLYGVCDFNKSCQEAKGKFIPYCGIPVYYYKCSECGFIFTDSFNDWDIKKFKENIYNEEYLKVDPDYTLIRPKSNAEFVSNIFSELKNEIKIIDYGGGSGVLEKNLREMGFKEVVTYDPFYNEFSKKPIGLYNLVISFEVIEHVQDPYKPFEEMLALLDVENGLMMFSTLLQPSDIDNVKTDWWYISPRNGHISIHTSRSIKLLLDKLELNFVSVNENLHVAFKTTPFFYQKLFKMKA